MKGQAVNDIGSAKTDMLRNALARFAGALSSILALQGLGITSSQAQALVDPEAIPAFVATVENEVPMIMKASKIGGVAIGLIVKGKLVYAKGFGHADHGATLAVTPDTVFLAASLAKPVAARLVVELAERGLIQLDRPVVDALPVWPLAASKFDHRSITIRNILSHTAGTSLGGYQGWLSFSELPTLAQSLAGKTNGRGAVELVAKPGSQFQYSGGGYTLMQMVVEQATGQKYVDLAESIVFRPLSMHRSSVALSPKVVALAAQGHGDDGTPVPMRYYVEQAPSTLTTTVNDFANWMIAGMFDPKAAPNSKLPKERLAEIYAPTTFAASQTPSATPYGLGHFIERLSDGSVAVGHDGRNQAGFRANFLMRPQEGDGIVFLTNSRSGVAMDRVICLWIADATKESPATRCKT
jgi:CubicO group peptidase (beta-lactamase class C family)